MKNVFCVMIAVLLLLCGCAENHHTPDLPEMDHPYSYNSVNGSDRIQTDGTRLYFWGKAIGATYPLLRYTPQTGRITEVCMDPVCRHRLPECSVCTLDTHSFWIHGNRIWFNRRGSYQEPLTKERIHVNEFVSYAFDTEKTTVIQKKDEIGGVIYNRQLFSENYRYYYDNIPDEQNGTNGIFLLCREDLKTGKTEQIGGEENTDGVVEKICFALNGRIYFTDGRRLFSRNEDNTDEILHCEGTFSEGAFGNTVCTDGNAVYFQVTTDTGSADIYRLNDINDYDSAEKIVSNCYRWILTEQYLYYQTWEKRVLGKVRMSGYSADELVLNGGDIHRCDHTGANDEIVFSFEGEYAGVNLLDMVVLGDKIYGYTDTWTDLDGDGVYRDGERNYSLPGGKNSGPFCIDANTGSAFVITGEE